MAFQPHSFMFQPHEEDRDHHHHHQINISSNPNNHLFHGGAAAGHETQLMMMKRSLSFSGIDGQGGLSLHGGGVGDQDDLSEDEGIAGEKKKRLSVEQVKTLEKSFEQVGNKLEPERKIQLAKALGLKPRQVAIWFQNRRARWKTKQLEKDYQLLRNQFDLVKADNDSLHAQNKKLHAELSALRGRDSSEAGRENDKKDQGDQGSWSNGSDQNSSDNNNNNINLDISRAQVQVMNNTASSASSQLIHGKNLFPSNLRPSSITQLLQGSSRSDLQCLKVDHPHQILQSEENFCNVLVNGGAAAGVEADHHQSAAGFWPWPEQHYFH